MRFIMGYIRKHIEHYKLMWLAIPQILLSTQQIVTELACNEDDEGHEENCFDRGCGPIGLLFA